MNIINILAVHFDPDAMAKMHKLYVSLFPYEWLGHMLWYFPIISILISIYGIGHHIKNKYVWFIVYLGLCFNPYTTIIPFTMLCALTIDKFRQYKRENNLD